MLAGIPFAVLHELSGAILLRLRAEAAAHAELHAALSSVAPASPAEGLARLRAALTAATALALSTPNVTEATALLLEHEAIEVERERRARRVAEAAAAAKVQAAARGAAVRAAAKVRAAHAKRLALEARGLAEEQLLLSTCFS